MPASSTTRWWVGAILLAFLALLFVRLRSVDPPVAAPQAGEGLEALIVETRRLEPARMVERLATTGTIEADEQVTVRSEIAGTVSEIGFDEGTTVRAGTLLIKLDDKELVAQRDRARFRVELARQRETRQADLLRQGLISQDDYDITLNQLNVLEAELRLADAELAKTEIRAPFTGQIGFRAVSLGAAISPTTPIARLQKLDPVKVEFTVPERYSAAVGPGREISFQVKGDRDRRRGIVYAVEPEVDRSTRSLRARARSANPDGALLPGAFADVEIVVSEVEGALTVPAIAVIPELGGKKVFVVEAGRATPRMVETGIRTDTEVQIVRGLDAEDEVIVSGVQQLVSGQRVTGKAQEAP
jgi:membrane fusion protein (multidrug efflux system)